MLMCVVGLCSTLMLVATHMYFYGWNVYAWQRTRINYPFIFEFSPGTELRFREVLLLSTGFTTFLLAGMNIHIAVTLLTYRDPQVPAGAAPAPSALQDSSTAAGVIPLILVLVRPRILTLDLISACVSNVSNRGALIILHVIRW